MSAPLEKSVARWVAAGLIDQAAAGRILEFESKSQSGFRWTVAAALALGGMLLSGGVLLFVASHWDWLSPASRMALVVAALAACHVGGAFAAARFPALATTLHAVGTVALGGAIYLSGQIFHLDEHWPNGVLLWAIGGWAAWWLLRDWPQTVLVALLTPGWIVSEFRSQPVFLLVTAFTYLSAEYRGVTARWRTALVWIGSAALLPLAVWVAAEGRLDRRSDFLIAVPLAVAFWMRGPLAWKNLVTVGWVLTLSLLAQQRNELAVTVWAAIGSLALIAWGIDEARTERINLGIAGFALTVVFFYFSQLMDKLDRALSLIVLGVVFLAGGWYLEQLRRRLVAGVKAKQA